MNEAAVKDLLLQAVETESGGLEVYRAALECVRDPDLEKEWRKYLEETEEHFETIRSVCEAMGIDPDEESPGRDVVRQFGESLVAAMESARTAGDDAAAEIVAAECVVLAETKDHQNWELLGSVAKSHRGEGRQKLADAHADIEDEEDEHLYHTAGWVRELWIARLGLPAVIPPPEEQKDVKSAIGAARAKGARKQMRPKKSG